MVLIETSVFTRQAQKLLSDDEYRQLQSALVARPEAGAVIPGSGGLRKARWSAQGRGKRGGTRIYLLLGGRAGTDTSLPHLSQEYARRFDAGAT